MSQHEQHHISIPCASRVQPRAQLPPQDLLNGTTEDYNEICLPLYKASISGNIAAAKVILGKRPELVRFSITESYETVLQIAVLGESPALVDYLVSIMSKDDLEIPNINGETALYKAAITGNTEIATILIRENTNLLHIPDRDGKTPIYIAALCRKRDMVEFLYKESQQMTGEFWTNENRGLVLMKCVEANLFDVALQMVTKHPVLATNGSVLRLLACKPHDFHVLSPGIISQLLNSFFRICPWKIQFPDKESDCDALQLLRFILKEIGKLPKDELVAIFKGPPDVTKEDEKKTPFYEKETQEALHLLRTISENIAKMPAQIFSLFKSSANNKTTALNDGNRKYSSQVLFLAAEMGNTTFIAEVIRQYPHLVREVNDDNQSIFHVAVSYGHVGVYKLLNELGSSSKDLIIALEDKDGNNMLHLVGEKAKGDRIKNVRGVGMQLNPEISWFKEIETIIPPRLQEKKNAAGLTPHQVFIKNHRDLFSKGEDWMKEIATQLMVVAALVATTSYQVAFQLPGGYGDDAHPTLINIYLFRLFLIFDALSFIASTTSILMVLSILGSNYDEYDFMISLSKQLTICLAFVFISIATMITTFLINFFLMYLFKSNFWLPILISVSAVTPFVIFAFSKYHLWSRIKCGFKMLYTTRKSRMN